MVERLDTREANSREQLLALLARRQETQADVSGAVREMIARVRAQGDTALCNYTKQFDRLDVTPNTLSISPQQCAKAEADCPANVRAALEEAAHRLRTYHESQLPSDHHYTDESGTLLGWQWRPIDAVGLYVPGGRASYPSSVLMNAIPARVAGAGRLVVTVPTPDGIINPALLVAAKLADIDEIYAVGGAQAIAALTYGTKTIAAVDKIVGPGNAYVTEAKRQVFGRVGIDTIAGPSEICVVSDTGTPPEWVAADLLSQAEHDPLAQAVFIYDDEAFAKRVEAAIERTLTMLERETIARDSWEKQGIMLRVPSVSECEDWINLIAPEHLELAIEAPHILSDKVRHAGAIFMGRYTPEAIGDYIAGPSHVLPTTRAARFASGLSVYDFLKKSSLIGCTQQSVQSLARHADALAQSEGLGAHALSARLRLMD